MTKDLIYKKVFEYLDSHQSDTIDELSNHFPEYKRSTLQNYLRTFRKVHGISIRKWQSYKPEVLAYLNTLNDKELAEITNTKLKKKFPKPSLITLSLHLWEIRKKRNVKPIGVHRERHNTKRAVIFKFLDENPDKRTCNDVYIRFPDFKTRTIYDIVIKWYNVRDIIKPPYVLTITAKWSDERLEKLRKEHYNTYVSTMHRLGREPKPQKHSPTHEAITNVKNTLTSIEKLDLTPAKACMLVSCKPAVELLKKIYHKYVDHMDFDKTEKVVREIEKRLFKKNIFRSYSTIVGTAIYLANREMPQTEAAKIMEEFGGCTEVSIRSLCRITKLRKKNYGRWG